MAFFTAWMSISSIKTVFRSQTASISEVNPSGEKTGPYVFFSEKTIENQFGDFVNLLNFVMHDAWKLKHNELFSIFVKELHQFFWFRFNFIDFLHILVIWLLTAVYVYYPVISLSVYCTTFAIIRCNFSLQQHPKHPENFELATFFNA